MMIFPLDVVQTSILSTMECPGYILGVTGNTDSINGNYVFLWKFTSFIDPLHSELKIIIPCNAKF